MEQATTIEELGDSVRCTLSKHGIIAEKIGVNYYRLSCRSSATKAFEVLCMWYHPCNVRLERVATPAGNVRYFICVM